MAKKLINPLEDPPSASSSDDDELETSGGEEEEAPSNAVTIFGWETDSESETERLSKAVVVTKKRPSEGSSRDMNAKRAKKVTLGEEEKNIKKLLFKRIWREEDEIALLQGMIDFNGGTGKSPYEDSNGLYEFIKKSISFEVSKNQFMDKIRSMKKKYLGKEKNCVEPSLLKAHDQKSYKLSKIIWGPKGIALKSVAKSHGKKLESVKQELTFVGKEVEDDKKVESSIGTKVEDEKKKTDDWFERSFLGRSIAGFFADGNFVKQGWSLVTVKNKKKLEDKLNALEAKELQEKTDLLHEAALIIIKASKKKKPSVI